MLADVRTWQHDAAVAKPSTVTNRHRSFGHDLHRDRQIEVFVPVILISDVDMVSSPHVVADLDPQVANNPTPLANEAPVADADDRVRDHFLAGHHAGRKGGLGPNHRAFADVDVLLVKERVWRETDDAVLSELAKPFAPACVGTYRTQLGSELPAAVYGFARCALDTCQQSLSQGVGYWVSFEHGSRRYRPSPFGLLVTFGPLAVVPPGSVTISDHRLETALGNVFGPAICLFGVARDAIEERAEHLRSP